MIKDQHKPKFIIFAFENEHYSIVNAVVRISDYENNCINIYAWENLSNPMKEYFKDDYEKIVWHLYKQGKTKAINRIKHAFLVIKALCTTKAKRIILTSPENNIAPYLPIYFFVRGNCEIVSVLHNINGTINPKTAQMNKKFGFRYKILQRSTAFAVLLETIKKEIETHRFTTKKIYVFPCLYTHEENNYSMVNYKKVFVITGSVNQHRKNYDIVLDALESLTDYFPRMQLILLGAAGRDDYAQHIIARCKELRNKGLDVSWYTEFVSVEVFHDVLKTADYLLSPINIHTRIRSAAEEIYGRTKASGAVLDMIEYAKPGIVPKDLLIPNQIADSVLAYSDINELKQAMVRALADEFCEDIKKKAICNAKKFSKEYYTNQFASS